MKAHPLSIVPLDRARHDRSLFHCGEPSLDDYLRERAAQDMARRVTNVFVAVDPDGRIGGYYTLASTGVPSGLVPELLARRLPRYPLVPAALIGRLAVDGAFRGKGLGAALLGDALLRVALSCVACHAVGVEAPDDAAAAFYRHFGFIPLTSRPHTLFLPVGSFRGPCTGR